MTTASLQWISAFTSCVVMACTTSGSDKKQGEHCSAAEAEKGSAEANSAEERCSAEASAAEQCSPSAEQRAPA